MHIHEVQLNADNLDNLDAFYNRQLGLTTDRDAEQDRLTVTVGTSQLTFHHTPGFAGNYHFAFNIPENRLLAAQKFLIERDIPLLADSNGTTTFDFDFWNAHALYFTDPAGNILECIARHELPNSSNLTNDVPFAAAELLNISEIGLPSANVTVLAALLSDVCAVAPYRETSAIFHPLGDANGLFILVPEGRSWFPNTGIAADGLPIQVQITNNANTRFVITGVPYHVRPFSEIALTRNP